MRTVSSVVLCLTLGASVAQGQLAVYDPAVTARTQVTAALQEVLHQVERAQHLQLQRMAQRLSAVASLDRYRVVGSPGWEAYRLGVSPRAAAVLAALTAGDAEGAAIRGALQAREELAEGSLTSRAALMPRLTTLDLADAALVATTHQVGQVRTHGRTHEQAAIEGLEAHVLDPSAARSAAATADALSGATRLGAQQRQARLQVLADLVEHLLLETKRARDTEADALNSRLITWRDGPAAGAAFAAGSGDALRTWRQP